MAGKVALVAGATRAARDGASPSSWARRGDRLRAPGARPASQRSEMDRPETIEETAELVDAAGGRGIAVPVDHLVPERGARRSSTRIDAEQGALHVLVNDIWGATTMEWDKTVWESSLDIGLRTLRLGVDTHAITSHFALPLLIQHAGRPGGRGHRRDRPSTTPTNYRVSFFYDLAKAAEPAHGVRPRPRAGAARRARPWRSRRAGCAPRRCSTPTA